MSRSGRPGRRSRRRAELHFITRESREKQPPATLLLAPCVALLYHLGTFMLDPRPLFNNYAFKFRLPFTSRKEVLTLLI